MKLFRKIEFFSNDGFPNKDCHEFKFSTVRIVMSVSNVTSLYDCSLRMGGGGKKFDMLVGTSGT